MKKILGIILILSLIGGGYWYFKPQSKPARGEHGKKERGNGSPFIATVKKQKLVDQFIVSGEITPDSRNSVEVKPEVSGKIKTIYPVIGQNVKAGDLLVELDDRDLQTDKDSAQTEIEGSRLALEKAKRLFERSQKLYEKKLVSDEEFENTKTDYLIAQNTHAKSQSRLRSVLDKIEKTKIISPMNGKVINLPVVTGQVVVGAGSVNAGTLLMTVADLSKMVISCHVNQVDIAHLTEKQPITFRVDSLHKENLKGSISIIAPTATSKNNIKGYAVTVQIDDLDPAIRPGMTADVFFHVKTIENALTLPLNAVFNDENDGQVVYVPRGQEEEPDKRVVTTGTTTLEFIEILSGVQEGEKVLLIKPRSKDK